MKTVVFSQNGYYVSPVSLTATGQSQLIMSQVSYQCMNFVALRETKKSKHKVAVVVAVKIDNL